MSDFSLKNSASWKEWPPLSQEPALVADVSKLGKRLNDDAARLFVPLGGEKIELLNVPAFEDEGKSEKRPFQTLVFDKVELLFDQLIHNNGPWVLAIKSTFSWGRLNISHEAFLKLMTFLEVNPRFLDVIHTFGDKVTPREESFLSCFTQIRWEPSTPSSDPEISSCGLATIDNDAVSEIKLHALILASVSDEWRDYINYLEDSLGEIVDRVLFSPVEASSIEGAIDTDFSDMRTLQILIDRFLYLANILRLNIQLSERLVTFGGKVKSIIGIKNFEEFVESLENLIFQYRVHLARVTNMSERGRGISSLGESLLQLRTAGTSHKIAEEMHDMAQQGSEENRLIRRLTHQAAQDTRSMSVIALITAIYLPATFAATLFGTNFFGFETNDNGAALKVASNIWIYVVAAVGLSSITVVSWCCWALRKRSNMKRVDEEQKPRETRQ